MIGAEYFWCPYCNAYTIETYGDYEGRCPICHTMRPDDAKNLDYAVNPSKFGKKTYRVDDGKRVKDFIDDRPPSFYVKAEPIERPEEKPKYLIMDEDSMFFALGDAPDPCERNIAEKISKDPNLRFNENGPVKIRYTKNPSLIGSLNLKPAKKGRRKGRR